MLSKKRKTKSKKVAVKQPSISFYRNIAVTFLALTVLLLLAVAYMSVKKVTIKVVTQPQTLQTSALARIGEKAVDMPHISGVAGQVVVESERDFTPTGTQEKETVARGKVKLINETNKNQPLVATTRLLNSEGVLFRMKEYATVPAGGEIEVEVYADKHGKASEIGPARFTIPGLWEPLQEKIYAVSEQPMVGGIQKIGVVSSEDIAQAKEEVRALIIEEARLKLQEQEETTDAMGYVVAVDAIVYEVDGADEEEVATFTVRAEAVCIVALYNQQEIIQLINGRLRDKVARQPVKLVLGNALPEVTMDSYDAEGKWVQLSVAHSGLTYLTEDSPAFDVLKFYGKNYDEIEQYVRGIEGVSGVSIRFRPAWSKVAPRVPEHIDVKVVNE